jgi:hypothetical protein
MARRRKAANGDSRSRAARASLRVLKVPPAAARSTKSRTAGNLSAHLQVPWESASQIGDNLLPFNPKGLAAGGQDMGALRL